MSEKTVEGTTSNGVQLELMKDASKVPTYNGEDAIKASEMNSSNSEPVANMDTSGLVDEDASNDPHKDVETSNIPMATFNIINSIIGSGLIGIPYAVLQSGIGLGAFLLVFVGVITDYSLSLLIEGGIIMKTRSYQGLAKETFGNIGYGVVSATQFSQPFFSMVAYNVIIGDTITKLVKRAGGEAIKNSVLTNRHFIVFLATLFVTLPLSLYKNIAALSKWGLASIVLISSLIVFIIIKLALMGNSIPDVEGDWDFGKGSFVVAITIMSHAYICHHNAFLVYESLSERTLNTWNKVTHLSCLYSALCLILTGICGYSTFKGYTQGDLLENYCYKDDFANVFRVVFTVIVALTYPIECFVTREVIENVFFSKYKESTIRHAILTIVLVGVAFAAATITDCLHIVLSINGSISAVPLIFIFPALFYMKVREEKLLHWKNILPLFLILLGIFLSIGGIFFSIQSILSGDTCSHGEELWYC
ncbi:unnamed protein product, partial [Owenia fusiformis]